MVVGKPVPPEKSQLDFLLEKPQPWVEEKAKSITLPGLPVKGHFPGAAPTLSSRRGPVKGIHATTASCQVGSRDDTISI